MSSYYFYKGRTELENQKLHDALKSFDRAIEYNSTTADFYFFKALTLFNLNDFKEAMDQLEQALKLDPKNPNYIFHKAKCFLKMQKFQNALEAIDKALEINPFTQEYLLLRNICLAALTGKQTQSMLKSIEDTIEKMQDKEVNLLLNKAIGFFNNKKFSEAKNEFEKLIKIDPKNSNYYRYKGLVLQEIGENEEALKNFVFAVKFNKEEKDDLLFGNILEAVHKIASTPESQIIKNGKVNENLIAGKVEDINNIKECKECLVMESEKSRKIDVLGEIGNEVSGCKNNFFILLEFVFDNLFF